MAWIAAGSVRIASLAAAIALLAAAPAQATVHVAQAPGGVTVRVVGAPAAGATVLLDGRAVGIVRRRGGVRIAARRLARGRHVVVVRAGTAQRTSTTRVRAAAARTTGATSVIVESPPAITTDRSARWTFRVPARGSATCSVDGGAARSCSAGRHAAANLALGAHTFVLRVTAPPPGGRATRATAKAATTSTVRQTWTVVPTAPAITVTAAPAASTTSTTATLGWTVSDRKATVACTLDAKPHADCDGATRPAGLALGGHVFAITARNAGGTATQTVAWTVVAPAPTPPTLTIASAPRATTTQTAATVAWRTGGTVSGTTCAVDGGAPAACASPLALTGLAAGAHVVAVTASGPQGSATASAKWTIVTRSIMWGAYVDGVQYGYQNPPWDMRALDAFEASAGGKHVSILHFGQPWYRAGKPQPFYTSPLEATRARGAIPLVDWSPWDSSAGGSPRQPAFALARIIDGAYDGYIRSWATGAKTWGHPFFLRMAHEMNGTWYPWSERANGNATGQFAAAWRHVHDLFEEVGATNVTWVWSPNVEYAGSIALAGLYPGDAYVDWVAMDGYNFGTNPKQPDVWKPFAQVFGPTYDRLGTLAPSKPVMIAEVGSTESGGDKAAWIRDALSVQIPDVFTRVAAVAWFNWQPEGIDWDIESSPAATAAFAAGIGGASYAGADFASLAGGRIAPLA